MSKKFFDVFPTLKMNQELQVLFEDVEVTKVVTNSDRTYLHVHFLSKHLLAKRYVYNMEKIIKEQLFGQSMVQIQLVEKYLLSSQYTPENFMREYRESILLELKQKSIVEHNMFANAKCTFENEQMMNLEFEDTIVAEGKAESIVSLLKDIFEVRCNIPVDIRVSYKKSEKSKMQEHNAARLQQEINAIVEANTAKLDEIKAEKKAELEAKKAEKEEKKAKSVQYALRKELYRAQKKSSPAKGAG